MKRVGIFLIMAALIAGMAGCTGGDDYPPCPTPPPSQDLEICTWYDLDDVRDNLAGNHTLMNDLDSTTLGYEELASPTAKGGKGWEPIGTIIPDCPYGGFTGMFDGQGYEIRDLYINRPDEDLVGLFGYVKRDGGIKDISVVNVTVVGKGDVGGLVGLNAGIIDNSYSNGSVTGEDFVGGLVGTNTGTVSKSHFAGSVVGANAVGSLVGFNAGIVRSSYSTGNVTGDEYIGGLVGRNDHGMVFNSYSTGSVTGNEQVGGLVGWNFYSHVIDLYFTGSVTGNTRVGGLIGVNDHSIVFNSYYNHEEVLINGENIITIGALFGEDFEQWLANNQSLDINARLSQEDGYYVVNNITDFKELLAFGQNDTLKFRLANDLDLGDEPNFYIPYLAGEFDGNGRKISNLSFNFDFVSHVGLFGYLAPGGNVTQLGVENVNITGASFVGGLVGINDEGTVSNSYSTGSVTGSMYVGGLTGWSLTRWKTGIVSDSYFTGSVTGNTHVGGLMGLSIGTVDSSYSTGSVTGSMYVGGLVGWNMGTVSNSYSTDNVIGSCYVGGLVGYSRGRDTISNSYSTGNVTGDEYVGGLVGSNGDIATVSNSYSTGSVTGNTHVGGLVGDNAGEGIVSNSFWDTQTSGQASSDGGTGKNTAQMKSLATFSGAAWNITAVALNETNPSYIWNIVNGATYPFLSWQPA